MRILIQPWWLSLFIRQVFHSVNNGLCERWIESHLRRYLYGNRYYPHSLRMEVDNNAIEELGESWVRSQT